MQVTIEDAAQADSLITVLMGDKVEPRREYIIQHAEFNKADHFDQQAGKIQNAQFITQE